MTTLKREFGDWGEGIAKEYFLKKGYRFLAGNFSYKKYEIDLIFEDENKKTIIFIEVKTRRSDRIGLPEESITKAKQEKIRKCAVLYIKLNPEYNRHAVRFDSFTIVRNENEYRTNHIEYAF